MTSSGNRWVARMDLRRYLEKKCASIVMLLRAGGSRDTIIGLEVLLHRLADSQR